jgi:hypothetical protein
LSSTKNQTPGEKTVSASLKAHFTVLQHVRQGCPREDLRRLSVFAWSVTALLLTGNVSLTGWALIIVGRTKASSRWRRLWRFLNNPHVDPAAYYRPFISKVLAGWAGKDVLVAIDTTSPKGQCVVCRIALVYRGRSIPLVWRSFATKGHTLAFEDYRPLLEAAAELLNEMGSVMLLGDRGFGSVELMRWCRQADWDFGLRLKRSRRIQLPNGQSRNLSEYDVAPGNIFGLRDVFLSGFGSKRFGPVNIFVVLAPDPKAEVWYIASDRADGLHVAAAYRCRMNIEHSFRDDKSGGFAWESSHLIVPEQVDRLLLVLAVATLYAVSEGVFVVEAGQRELIDPHSRRGLSYFQIGCRALNRAVALGQRLKLRLHLNPAPDPDPLTQFGITFKIFNRFEWWPGDTLPAGV